jgi:hypothetical protein
VKIDDIVVKNTEKFRLLTRKVNNTILTQDRVAIGTFPNREAAGRALDRIVFSGFPIAKVFLIGHDADTNSSTLAPNSFGTITGTASGLKKGMYVGNLAGGTTGLALGMGLIALPGVGQLALSSAIAFVAIGSVMCTVAGGFSGALIGLGLTSERAKEYSRQVSKGSFLLIVEGSDREIDLARQLIKQSAI